ncbi:hypothetical protein GALL_543850 [mine drainage metagenome]|uniref:Uncharacterized protein n=1 Tax=mine drainage metagenome TaxID=410659 RepID=A0A1J5PFN7_9ZZZZ
MAARNTLGDHSAAVPLSATTCCMPRADALRKIVPTLPASCNRSSTTVRTPACTTACALHSTTKPIWAGDSSPLMLLNRLLDTTATFAARSAQSRHIGCAQACSVITHCAGTMPRARQAEHRLSPSSQNSPSLR